MLFGRELRAPHDLFTEDIEPETYENIFGNQENLKKRAAYEMHKNIRQIMCRVQRTFNAHVQYMSKQYNKNVSDIFFEVGDWVYVKINIVKFKFAPTWKGPGQITEKLSDILYVVKIGDEEKVTNISKLKPYKPSKYFPPPNFDEKIDNQVNTKTNESKSQSNDDDDEDFEEDRWHYVYRPITYNNDANNDSVMDNKNSKTSIENEIMDKNSETGEKCTSSDKNSEVVKNPDETSHRDDYVSRLLNAPNPRSPQKNGNRNPRSSVKRAVSRPVRFTYDKDHVAATGRRKK